MSFFVENAIFEDYCGDEISHTLVRILSKFRFFAKMEKGIFI
jgi:hypothetical protein